MKTIAISIEEEVLARVDRVAGAEHPDRPGNRSKVIRAAVREYLARLESAVQEEREREILRRHSRRLARQTAALVKEQAKP
jgi:metal-responsive CopG/Arc/MetJ family transcriptional regulator